MDDFDRLVELARRGGQSPAELDAVQRINALRVSADGWRFCIARFGVAAAVEGRFLCLTVLEDTLKFRAASLADADLRAIQAFAEKLLTEFMPANSSWLPFYFSNKVASFVAAVFKLTYLTSWPNFFSVATGTLGLGLPMVNLFCRLLRSIDEEVVSSEMNRSATEQQHCGLIKDAMRARANTDIAGVWFQILKSLAGSQPEIVNNALQNIQHYIGWIDLQLIVNDQFIPLLQEFLKDDRYRARTASCFAAIIRKKMDPLPKLNLIASMRLVPTIAVLQSTSLAQDDDDDFLYRLSQLLGDLSKSLMDAWERLERAGDAANAAVAETMMVETLPQMLRFITSNDEAAGVIIGAANAFVSRIKAVGVTPERANYLAQLLSAVTSKMRYDNTYQWDASSETDAEFDMFRKSLANVVSSIGRAAPAVAKSFALNTLSAAVQNAQALPFEDVELALTLVYSIGEGVKTEAASQNDPLWQQLIGLLLTSELSHHPHHSVVLQYFECIHRYARLIGSAPQFIGPLLDAFIGARGLLHPHATVRGRVCFLLVRFVRTLRAQLNDHVYRLLTALGPFLSLTMEQSSVDIPLEQRLHLFECVGVLINGTEHIVTATKSVVTPIMAKVSEILSNKLFMGDTPQYPVYTTMVCHGLAAVASITKGFSESKNEAVSADINALFMSTLPVVMQAFDDLHTVKEVRRKVSLYIHLMIEQLRTAILPQLTTIFQRFFTYLPVNELSEIILLVRQLVDRFKAELKSFISAVLAAVTSRVAAVVDMPADQTQDTAREVKETLVMFVNALLHLINNGMLDVLVDGNNLPSLQTVLRLAKRGMETLEAASQKLCLSLFSKMVEAWGATEFKTFVLRDIVPTLFASILSDTFNLSDGQMSMYFTDCISFLVLCQRTVPGFATDVTSAVANVMPAQFVPNLSDLLQRFGAAELYDFLKGIVEMKRAALDAQRRADQPQYQTAAS